MTLERLRPAAWSGRGRRVPTGWMGMVGRVLALLLVLTVLPLAAGEGWTGHDCPHHAGYGAGDGPHGGDAGHGSHHGHGAAPHGGAPPSHAGMEGGAGQPVDSDAAGGGQGHGHDHGPCTCVGLCTLGAAAFAGSPEPALRVQPGLSSHGLRGAPVRGRSPSAPLLYALPRANAPPRA